MEISKVESLANHWIETFRFIYGGNKDSYRKKLSELEDMEEPGNYYEHKAKEIALRVLLGD